MDYEQEFRIFSSNVNLAARSFYYHQEMQQQVYKDCLQFEYHQYSPLFQAVDANAQFWNDYKIQSILHAIITLGRVFDKNKNSHSIKKLVKVISTSKPFTVEKLKNRKLSGSDNAPEWIDAYIVGKIDFSDQDYRNLEQYVQDTIQLWDNNIKDVRAKLYAHQERLDARKRAEILEKAQYSTIDEIIRRLLSIEYTLWEAYHNGKEPDFAYTNDSVRERCQKDIAALLERLSKEFIAS